MGPTPHERLATAFEQTVREEYTHPSAVIDERGEVLLVSGPLSRYLRIRPGVTSPPNLLEHLPGGLRRELRSALQTVAAKRRRVVKDGIPVERDEGSLRVRLVVRPMPGSDSAAGLFLVVLQEAGAAADGGEELAAGEDQPEVHRLESELSATRAELKSTVEQLETANEELKSSNEELLSTNEELQSANEELQASKEELQSLNEELETVNAELRQKVDELGSANNDLQNLFQATDVATIFLDRELRIAKYTPRVKALFNVLDQDVGRHLADLAPRVDGVELVAEAESVLRSLQPAERHVRTPEGAWFVLRLLPYRTVGNAVQGVVVTFVDVTALRKVEEQARRLAQLLHIANDAILVWRFDTGLEYWNRGAEALYGHPAAAAMGRKPDDLLDSVAPAGPAITAVHAELRLKGRWSGELTHRTRDGRRVTVLANLQLVRGEDGVERVLEANRDITERKEAELALRRALAEAEEGRRLLDAIMEFVPEGITVADAPDVRIRMVSRYGRDLTGRSRELLEGIPVAQHARTWDLYDRDGVTPARGEDLPLSRATQRGEVVRGEEWTLGSSDGERIPILCNAGPIRDASGQVVGGVIAWRDIRDLKQAEARMTAGLAAAQRHAAEIDAILNAIPHAVYFGDASGITRCNDEALRLLGATSVEDLRARIDELGKKFRVRYERAGRPVEPENLPFVRALRGEVASLDTWATRASTGEDVLIRGNSAPVVVNGKLIGAVAVNIDITDQYRMHESLRAEDARKNDFLALLSHELRNPLAPIQNAVSILERAAPGSDAFRRALPVLGRQTAQLTRLVDDLLDLTRIARNKIQLRVERIDLGEMVRRTVEDHRSVFASREVGLAFDPPPSPVHVRADPARMSQVVGNLLQNAAKFTGASGTARVAVGSDRAAGRAFVTVADTGAGMDAATLGQLFQPFMQAAVTLDRSKGGLGLGLALVKGLVELHGGEVTARSDGLGRGSELVVRLPLDRAAEAPGQPAAPGTVPPRRILVVEDNVDAADTLADLLSLSGHEVEVAYGGPAALEAARRSRPDVVFCDIGLPGMDGYAVARAFRADARLRDVRLVALTGYAAPEDVRRAQEAGFDRHIAKPPRPEQVQEVLATP